MRRKLPSSIIRSSSLCELLQLRATSCIPRSFKNFKATSSPLLPKPAVSVLYIVICLKQSEVRNFFSDKQKMLPLTTRPAVCFSKRESHRRNIKLKHKRIKISPIQPFLFYNHYWRSQWNKIVRNTFPTAVCIRRYAGIICFLHILLHKFIH